MQHENYSFVLSTETLTKEWITVTRNKEGKRRQAGTQEGKKKEGRKTRREGGERKVVRKIKIKD